MEDTASPRNALLGILLTWCAYIAFALATDWGDFGLEPYWPVSLLKYTIARLSVTSLWLIFAIPTCWFRPYPMDASQASLNASRGTPEH